MKFLLRLVFLGLVMICLFSSCSTFEDVYDTITGATYKADKQDNIVYDSIKEVSIDELEKLMRSDNPPILLDARVEQYFDNYVIPGAIWVNYHADEEQFLQLCKDKNQLIITYCGNSECPLSKRLATRLIKFGYKNIYDYSGGIAGWRAAGKDVIEYNKAIKFK